MSEDWVKTDLGSLLTRVRRPVKVLAGSVYPAVSVTKDGQGLGDKDPFIGGKTNYSTLYEVRQGDVVVRTITAFESPVGVAQAQHDHSHVSQVFLTYEVRDGVLPEFLGYTFQTPAFWWHMRNRAQGTVLRRKTISHEAFAGIPISLPPLPVQQRIVDLMAHLDNHLATLQAEASALKAALAGLRDEAIAGLIDQWGTQTLAQVLSEKPTYGVVKPGPDPADGVFLVRSGDIRDGVVDTSGLRRITHEVHEEYARSQIREGDVLVALVGTPGAVSIAPSEVFGTNIARQVGLLRCGSGITPGFLELVLMSPLGKVQLSSKVKGAVQQVINLGDLAQVTIPLPDLQTQERLAAWHFEAKSLTFAITKEVNCLVSLRQKTLIAALSGSMELPLSYDTLLSEAA